MGRYGFNEDPSMYNEGAKAPSFGNYTPAPAPGGNPQQLPSSNTVYPRAGIAGSRSETPGNYLRSIGGMRGQAMGTPAPGGLTISNRAMYRPSAFANTGVTPGNFSGPNAVQAARMHGPSIEQIQADMARRQTGAALGNSGNSALAGYMIGK